MNLSKLFRSPSKIFLIHKFKKLFLFLVCLVFHTPYSNAEIIFSLPSNSTRIDFGIHNPESTANGGPGPITENGITWSTTSNRSVYGYTGGYGLNENGSWSGISLIGLNETTGTMRIEFARLTSSVFGLLNYAPMQGFGKIAIYDSTNTLIASQDLSISTPSGINEGLSIGYRSNSRNIKYITLSDAYIVLANLYASYGASAADTQSSMQYQARQLRSAFNTQTVAANFALNYDCNVFDVKGMCISAGGRYTTIDNPGINNLAAVVTLGYKVNPNIRIGGYLDQNINISHPTGINISNNTPLMGLYAVWNKEQSGLGYQVRLANTYQDKDVTQTRTVFDTSEAGSGKSSLKSQSYLAELSYAFQYEDKTLVRPYAGLRYTHLKQDGYTEGSVDNPLTLAALRDKSATALLGVKVQRSLTDKATLTAQLGIEQDVHHKVGNYSATNSDIGNLDSVAFNSNIKRTRPVASIGAFYDVTKTQRASATINYQQLPFQSTGSTTAYFNYMIGF
jgi:hypothetical protein